MLTAGDTARKGQTVNIGPVFIIQHQACAIVAAKYQLIVAHLSTHGQTHLVGGRGHEEVTIEGTYHFMSRPRVACCHAHRCLAAHCFFGTQTGLHHNVRVGQVHLDHAHFEGQCRDVIFGGNDTRTRQMRENERVYLIGLVTNHPLVTGRSRDRSH